MGGANLRCYTLLPRVPFALSKRTMTTIIPCYLPMDCVHANTSDQDKTICHLQHIRVNYRYHRDEKTFKL